MTNEELVRKAAITTDAIATVGRLNAAQSEKFIDYVIDESVLKNNARIIRFRNSELEIDKIGIGNRVTYPKAEAQDPAIRRGITTSKVTMTPKTLITPFEISDEFQEENIEGDDIEDTIIRLMARQLSNDLELLYINGDILGPSILQGDYLPGGSATQYVLDQYLKLFSGWLRNSDGANVYDAASKNIGLSVFSAMLRQLPTKYRRNRGALRWYMSPDLAQLYLEKLSTRATALGDSASGGAAHAPFGVPIVEVPLFQHLPPVVEHFTLAASATQNLRYGPVSSVNVLPQTLSNVPTTAYILDTDYSLNSTTGSITNLDAGISDGEALKVTYAANPQLILTHMKNFIIGIGRDIRIEKGREIFKGVNQYAITTKVACEFEELEAIAKGINLGTGV